MGTRRPRTGRKTVMNALSRRNFIAVAGSAVAATAAAAGLAVAEEPAALNPGTYTVTVESIKGPMTVAVSFSRDVISDVHVVECNDSAVIKDVAIQSVGRRIVEQQNVGVDGATGATFTSLALKSAVCEAIGLAGGDVAAFEKGSDAVAEKAQGKTEEFDLVIVGAGAAGISAAITAARTEAAPSVLLLEKQAFVGGCYRVCGGGIWTMGAPINEWVGQDCTAEQLVEFMQGRSGDNKIDAELWGNIHDISADVFMYMMEQGVAINPLTWSLGNPDSQIPCFWTCRHSDIPWEDVVSGWSDQEQLIADRLGVQTRLNSRVTELVVTDGAVTGVVVEDRVSVYQVNAKKVIIATGGFTQSAEYREQYAPDYANAFAFTSAGDTGDGIAMTRGLDVPVVGEGMMGLMGLNPSTGYYGEFGSLVWSAQVDVNAEGEVVDIAHTFYGDTLALLCQQTGGLAYGIYDATSPVAARLEKAVGVGHATKYDTLEELAADKGIAVEPCVANCDGAVSQAPFYCLEIRPLFIGSIPGLKVDSLCRVLNSQGEAVENLYAAGMVMFGNVFNVAYPSSGTGVGVSHYTGAIAARDAVAAIA